MDKPKIKLSELTDMYDIEEDEKQPEEKALSDTMNNFSMEIEEVISKPGCFHLSNLFLTHHL